VNNPTIPMKTWMPSPMARVSFSSSMKSHTQRDRSSAGEGHFRPRTRRPWPSPPGLGRHKDDEVATLRPP
jgi:hypothetical protein